MMRLPTEATMIELGGYWSFYSLWFLLEGESRYGIIVEPDPIYLEVGKTNARLNGLTPTFIQGFVGAIPASAKPFQTATSGEIVLPCFNVPLLMEMHGIDQLEILHCDTQGAEFDVLRSCEKLFEQQRIRFVFVSTHDFRICGDPLIHNCGGRIIAEHDVHESYSGDGLIVAYFGDDPRCGLQVPISFNRYSESLFRNPLYDLALVRSANSRST